MASRKEKAEKKPRLRLPVCKPCWELKYCPYGPLVEYFPLAWETSELQGLRKSYKTWVDAVREGRLKTREQIYEAIEKLLCLDPLQLEWTNQYQTEELTCSVFGHICPVFFTAEPFTETKEDRRVTRAIPREIMLQVVRRDGQACRICGKNVRDDEVEFDHIIPHSRGGPMTTENIRLLCRKCNRKKKDSLHEILDTRNVFERAKGDARKK